MSNRMGFSSGALIAALTLAACSGSDAAPPSFNATGHWQTWLTDPTNMEESGPYGSYVLQTGAALDGVGVSGSVSGNNLNMSVDVGLIGLMTFNGAMSGTEIAGTFQLPGFPGSANFRMQPFTPAGTVTANGTIGGLAVAVSSTTAFSERYYSDIALSTLMAVNVVDDNGVVRFEINFEQPGGLAVGTIDASVVPITVLARDDTNYNEATAVSGSVTITQYDSGGFVATFNLTLPGSETVSGSFNVVFDLNVYDP